MYAWEIKFYKILQQDKNKNKIDARKKMRSPELTEGRETGEK